MNENILGVFGGVKIPMEWCDNCKTYAFVIDGILQCCDRKTKIIPGDKLRPVRFSEGTGKRNRVSKKDRERILKEQNNQCIYCGIDLEKEIIHFDHFIPFAFEYSKCDIDNMVASCSACNLLKSDRIYNSKEEVWDDIKKDREKRMR